MSFASILAEPAEERHPRKVSPPVQIHSTRELPTASSLPKSEKFEKSKPSPEKRRQATHYETAYGDMSPRPSVNGVATHNPLKSRKTLSERENERIIKALERIDAADQSDIEAPGFEEDWERYIIKGKKRAREAAALDLQKRKVCIPPAHCPCQRHVR